MGIPSYYKKLIDTVQGLVLQRHRVCVRANRGGEDAHDAGHQGEPGHPPAGGERDHGGDLARKAPRLPHPLLLL